MITKVEKIVKWLFLILAFAAPAAAFPQQTKLPVSSKYPLQAHIVSVEIEQKQHLSDGSGEISESHLMKAEIDGKTYGLAVPDNLLKKRPFEHRTWLETGFYPARRIKHGFEFEYMDGDKVRHEELQILFQE